MNPGRMSPGRRLVAVLSLGLLAVAGLVACRSDPTVAAYVGDTEITEERVDGVLEALRVSLVAEIEGELEALREQAEQQEQEAPDEEEYQQQREGEIESTVTGLRERVVEMLVLTEAGGRYAEAEGVSVPEPNVEAVAQQLNLAADHPYAELFATFSATFNALQSKVEPAAPSEADQREAYQNMTLAGQPLSEPFEQLQELFNEESMGFAVGARNLMVAVVDFTDMEINPRYDLVYRVPIQLGEASSWLEVRISEGSSVVDSD